MRCTNCGVENDENAQYCKNCGKGLNASTSMDTKKKGVPKHIKKIVYPGWLAVYLLGINFFAPRIYLFFMHETLNGILEEINTIILILAILISIYFYIEVYKIKDEIKRDPDIYYNKIITYIAIIILLALTGIITG